MRNRKYPQPLDPTRAAALDPKELPVSSRPSRSVAHRTDRHSLRNEALIVLSHPATYSLFATVPVVLAMGAYPAAVYSAFQALLGVFPNQAAVLRELRDDAVLRRALLRGLSEHTSGEAVDIIQRSAARGGDHGLPSRASWQRFLDLVEEATQGNVELVREQFRAASLLLALAMGHFNPSREATVLTDPDPRTFATADGTVIKSPTDNTDTVVYDKVRGEARTKRVDPSRSAHHEGGQADEGRGVSVAGTKFVMLHSHGPAWQDTITLDLAHDSEQRPGRGRGQAGDHSEVELALGMFYRLAERQVVDDYGQPAQPYVAGLVYDKALRGVHAQQLAQRGYIAVADHVRLPAQPEESPDAPARYGEMDVQVIACDNLPYIAPGEPGHVHTLVARRGRIYERHLTPEGSELREPARQRAQRRRRANGITWYREVEVDCPYGDKPHIVFIPILPPPPRAGQRARRDTRERGEYLRIFAWGEDTYNGVKANRALAENRNSVLDGTLPFKRIGGYGSFRQTMFLLGYYLGQNILAHHYVLTHTAQGDCLARPDDDGELVVYLAPAARPRHAHRPARSSVRRDATRPSHAHPDPVRPPGRP